MEIEKELENLKLDKYDEEDGELVFTTELGRLKPKKEGEEGDD